MQTFPDLGTAFDAFGWLEAVVQLVLAIVAGAVLGWERERLGKAGWFANAHDGGVGISRVYVGVH